MLIGHRKELSITESISSTSFDFCKKSSLLAGRAASLGGGGGGGCRGGVAVTVGLCEVAYGGALLLPLLTVVPPGVE